MSAFLPELTVRQATVIVVLVAVSFIAGYVHWAIVARVSRLRAGSRLGNRLAPYGVGGWHLGVLRRSWYPAEALSLRRWALLTYAISMGALVVAWGLMMIWVVL
jgi:hypothetical protein